jgi:hypothetical protein
MYLPRVYLLLSRSLARPTHGLTQGWPFGTGFTIGTFVPPGKLETADQRSHRRLSGAYDLWNRRVPTPQLNRWLEEAQSRNPPPLVSGRVCACDT